MSGLDRDGIASLIPHQGGMCLLDRAETWTPRALHATARSHLNPHNPLRRDGRLGIVCGAEYGLQAAALHGALLTAAAAARRGYVASLSLERIRAARLDDPSFGLLNIRVSLELDDPGGTIYGFTLHTADGRLLLEGRGSILFGLPHP